MALLTHMPRVSQTDYNKWDKIVAALSDDDEDVAPAAAPRAPLANPVADAVGVGAALTGAHGVLWTSHSRHADAARLDGVSCS